jgi:uncharacterized protein YukE
MSPQYIRRKAGVPILIVLLLALVLVVRNPYSLTDWIKLRGYTPSPAIAAIAEQTTMTDKARHLFYINHPELSDKTSFRANCPQNDEQTIVIGCYASGQRGIFVLNVDDSRLAGVEEVTSAHEMLHAAYERLGKSERKRIDKLLQQYADTSLTNERIKDALEGYKKTEPGQQLNEMHSMFGTEIGTLPTELDEYYSRYFSDRAKVVAAADDYQEAFTSRQNAIKQYDEQLTKLNDSIKSNTTELNDRSAALVQSRKRLDNYRQNGDIDAYNNGVESFNASVNAYNTLLDTTREQIRSYNSVVEERNAIAAQTVELQKAIDSSSLPESQ